MGSLRFVIVGTVSGLSVYLDVAFPLHLAEHGAREDGTGSVA